MRACIVAASVYTTNQTTSATSAVSVVSGNFNDKVPVRPEIAIHPVEKEEANAKFGGTEGKKMLNVFVDCWADKTLYVDQIAQQVEAAVKAYAWDGVQLVAVTSNNGLSLEADNKYQLKTLTFTFDRE